MSLSKVLELVMDGKPDMLQSLGSQSMTVSNYWTGLNSLYPFGNLETFKIVTLEIALIFNLY